MVLMPGFSDHEADQLMQLHRITPVYYTHLRAHETLPYLVCRLLLEKKKLSHTLRPPLICFPVLHMKYPEILQTIELHM